MLIPFAVDIPIALTIVLSDHFSLLNPLIIGLSGLIHINHVFSVDLAERQARPFELTQPDQPITCAIASLKRRRLVDYTHPKVEWAVAALLTVSFAWLGRYYFAGSERDNLRMVFGVPAVLLYIQGGLLLVKLMIVGWRSPIPRVETAEHVEVREKTRRYYLWTCDCYRIGLAATTLFWAIQVTSPAWVLHRVVSIWMSAAIVIGVAVTIWVEIKRKQLVGVALRTVPAKLPDFLFPQPVARWPICHERSVPLLLLKGARGYSVNLANILNRLAAVYLVGLLLLLTALRLGS